MPPKTVAAADALSNERREKSIRNLPRISCSCRAHHTAPVSLGHHAIGVRSSLFGTSALVRWHFCHAEICASVSARTIEQRQGLMVERNVAIVTGGASGIGLAIAKTLLGEGWKLILADLAEG